MRIQFIYLLSLLILCSPTGCASDKVKGNGKIVTRTIPIEDFEQLSISRQIDSKRASWNLFQKNKKNFPVFEYKQSSGSDLLEVTMDENLFDWLVVDQNEKKLYIKTKKGVYIKPTQLTIKGGSSELSKVELYGCMSFKTTTALNVDNIQFNLLGFGDIQIDGLTCNELNCDLSGVGNIYLNGTAQTGKYILSGVGNIKAYNCEVKNLSCEVSGVGNMQVMATDQLDAGTSGVGGIKYRGEASANTWSSGIGRVKYAN